MIRLLLIIYGMMACFVAYFVVSASSRLLEPIGTAGPLRLIWRFAQLAGIAVGAGGAMALAWGLVGPP